MRNIIDIQDHEANDDKNAILVWEDKRRNVHIYQAKGGFVACPDFCKAYEGFYSSLKEAKDALK